MPGSCTSTSLQPCPPPSTYTVVCPQMGVTGWHAPHPLRHNLRLTRALWQAQRPAAVMPALTTRRMPRGVVCWVPLLCTQQSQAMLKMTSCTADPCSPVDCVCTLMNAGQRGWNARAACGKGGHGHGHAPPGAGESGPLWGPDISRHPTCCVAHAAVPHVPALEGDGLGWLASSRVHVRAYLQVAVGGGAFGECTCACVRCVQAAREDGGRARCFARASWSAGVGPTIRTSLPSPPPAQGEDKQVWPAGVETTRARRARAALRVHACMHASVLGLWVWMCRSLRAPCAS